MCTSTPHTRILVPGLRNADCYCTGSFNRVNRNKSWRAWRRWYSRATDESESRRERNARRPKEFQDNSARLIATDDKEVIARRPRRQRAPDYLRADCTYLRVDGGSAADPQHRNQDHAGHRVEPQASADGDTHIVCLYLSASSTHAPGTMPLYRPRELVQQFDRSHKPRCTECAVEKFWKLRRRCTWRADDRCWCPPARPPLACRVPVRPHEERRAADDAPERARHELSNFANLVAKSGHGATPASNGIRATSARRRQFRRVWCPHEGGVTRGARKVSAAFLDETWSHWGSIHDTVCTTSLPTVSTTRKKFRVCPQNSRLQPLPLDTF